MRLSRSPIALALVLVVAALVLVASVIAGLSNSEIGTIAVTVTDPVDGQAVGMQPVVKGQVSDPRSTVNVLVHPMASDKIWVQGSPIVSPSGDWQIQVSLGTESLGINERYELLATATHENLLVTFVTGNLLTQGQVLDRVPLTTNRSNVVTVVRPA